jgi:hypothetical protein
MSKICCVCGREDSDFNTTGAIFDDKYYCMKCKTEENEEISIEGNINYLRSINENISIIKNIAMFWFILTIIGLGFMMYYVYKVYQIFDAIGGIF